MGLETLAYSMADPDYYEPPHRFHDQSPEFRPATCPDGWVDTRHDGWLMWDRPGTATPDQGWKIHVSAQLGRAQVVLDVVAGACFAANIPFKHLATEHAFLFMHHKHAHRAQSGKFCAIYPPDRAAARRMLDQLAEDLCDEDGPYILTDRRYKDSRTVHYRYGAFRRIAQVGPDGRARTLVSDPFGQLVDDLRVPRFTLPKGITDPFLDSSGDDPPAGGAGAAEPPDKDGVRVGRYVVLRALAQSNAGGAYRAEEPTSSRSVFIKEARAYNGLYWDRTTAQQRLRREHRVLRDLHHRAPGLAPAPVDYFREWEHEFLVTELVPGSTLADYVAQRSPLTRSRPGRDEVDAYYEMCRGLIRELAEILEKLHALGYRFGDLNPMNVMVTPDGHLRLIDFEACGRLDEPPIHMGAPGFLPAREQDREGVRADDYALSAIALGMIMPLQLLVARNPAALDHLRADIDRYAPVPADIWQLATRHVTATAGAATCRPDRESGGCVPSPEEVDAEPVTCLRWLHEAVGRDLVNAAAPDDPYRVYATVPRGYATNTLCFAYGTAGVLHALHHAGLPTPASVVDRFRHETLRRRDDLPPGLHSGTAGIAWVLAELGQLNEAVDVADAAASHPATLTSCTWGEGSSGVGATSLALHDLTADGRHLDRADAIGRMLCATGDLVPLVGPRNAVGLLHGRAGVALFLYYLWRATGEERYLRHGITLLHAELDRAIPMPDDELAFPDNEVSRRAMTYLATGSAGMAYVLTRYVAAGGDERLTSALPRVISYVNKRMAVEPGLYQGLAGMAFALADHADAAGGTPGPAEDAVRTATALFKYAVPAGDGRVRFLGEHSLRFSNDLWSGSAGVLLVLDRILNGPSGQWLCLDRLVSRQGPSSDRVAAGRSGEPTTSERR